MIFTWLNAVATISMTMTTTYSAKRWQWKMSVNPTKDYIGKKTIGNCTPHK